MTVGCSSDSECATDHACRLGECTPVCGADGLPCGGGASCRGVAHQPVCTCLPGLEGDPYDFCTAVECEDNSECPPERACVNRRCQDPCAIENPCGREQECSVVDHVVDCSCPEGYQGTRGTACVTAEVPCTSDHQCPSKTACIRGQCENPCLLAEPCGVNAECTVLDTLPVRTMTCVCLEG